MAGEAEVEALVREGRYAEAAAAARRLGDLVRAQALLERIWDFRGAAEVARERGDRPALLHLLLELGELGEAARVGELIVSGSETEQARAAEVYERHQLWGEAASLRERLGRLGEAKELYARARQPLEVARLELALGHPRAAGRLYERFLQEESSGPEAPRAHLGLGRILLELGQLEPAVRQLQRAIAGSAEDQGLARELLTLALFRLGYAGAASRVLDELRTTRPELPELDAFVASVQPAASGSERLAGRYQVLRPLGAGGLGRVYLARDALQEREVAIKVVPAPIDARSRDGWRRFVQEARLLSSLRHPNLVEVIEFDEALGILTMEHMSGGTLADRLTAPLPPETTRGILRQLLAGLGAAHTRGVVHRDVKPANIFFDASGAAKLGDFGVAHLQDLGTTQTNGFIGTLGYMSPEQISGARVSFATDVYGLAVTTFQMLTGRLPFLGPDLVGQHLGAPPPRLSSLRPDLKVGWDALVARGLEKDPAARFTSLDELAGALEAIPAGPRLEPERDRPRPPNQAPPAAPQAGGRWTAGTEIGRTAWGSLWRATDARLGREVILERWEPGYAASPAGATHLAWLRAIARGGGPQLQRILALEHLPDGGLQIVFESVAGSPLQDPHLDPATSTLLRRALDPLHAEGMAHGALRSSIVLEEHGPTILVAGRAPSDGDPAAELEELARLLE